MRTLVVAPHPDDETLGCGGTLLRRRAEGCRLAWLIVTGISEHAGWSTEQIVRRNAEIAKVAEMFGFSDVFKLDLPAAELDTVPMRQLVAHFSRAFSAFQPNEVLLPNRCDVHTDHRVAFDAGAACAKWFRYPSVRRVLAYETISETEFALNHEAVFRPNCFIDISHFLERKLEILRVYESEIGLFPFPRSVEAVRAQAVLRGATSGFMAAEAFQLLRERL